MSSLLHISCRITHKICVLQCKCKIATSVIAHAINNSNQLCIYTTQWLWIKISEAMLKVIKWISLVTLFCYDLKLIETYIKLSTAYKICSLFLIISLASNNLREYFVGIALLFCLLDSIFKYKYIFIYFEVQSSQNYIAIWTHMVTW